MANDKLSASEQLTLLTRGAEGLYSFDDLKKKLERSQATGKPLRVKLGLDPTAPDIHLGHTVVLRKLRQFQDLGHQAVLIIGDATGRIGDPTGRSQTRPVLGDEDIKRNLKTYLEQVKHILDVDRVETVFNSAFFTHLRFDEVMKLAAKVTVARLMERDDFNNRYKQGVPIGLHEFFYPLMQGWDSVQVRADVELGGTDQTFNNLMGRDLQRQEGQEPQVVLVMPILPGLDGVQKMSKSLGNYVGVAESPTQMFGKLMSIPDNMMSIYYTLLTAVPEAEFKTLIRDNPREAKGRLAREIVSFYHSPEAAVAADEEFRRIFAQGQLPDEIPEVAIPASELENGEIWICKLIQLAAHAGSTSDARRLIEGGAVTLDGEKVADFKAKVKPVPGQVLKSGKRKFAKIAIKG